MNPGQGTPPPDINRAAGARGSAATRFCAEEAVKAAALRLGFSAVGITRAEALRNREKELSSWLRAGLAGPLLYMEEFFLRQERFLSSFPEARSVIVLGADYGGSGDRGGTVLAAEEVPQRGCAAARISRYALQRDYHRVLRKRLKQLEATLREMSPDPIHFRRTVDTSPVQERALAEAAGLGFFGKNTCLIRPKGGSFFFLCTLITSLPLEPDRPISWNCGNCTLCLEACPTGALPEAFRLDASRCISSLTIEHKGPIPKDLRPHLQDWVFGCDICQQVCPYNHAAPTAPAEDFPAMLPPEIPLSDVLLCRTQEQFLQMFQGTPLTRPGREGLLRNAAISAGNLADPGLIPELENCLLHDSSALVRSHAAWALGKIKDPRATEILRQATLSEADSTVKEEILQAIR